MDVVLVGLPGSGKSAIGRRLATRHGATFVDLDQVIERAAGATVPELFAAEGEAGFRARESAAIEALGAASDGPAITRVIAPGGGAIVDPRNRWRLFRGRHPIWLDARPEAIAQRLRNSPFVRPLVRGQDPLRAVRELGTARLRFYAAATRVNAMMEVASVVAAVEAAAAAGGASGTVLLRAETPIGAVTIGDGIATSEIEATLRALEVRRAILVSEPGAWAAVGKRIAGELEARGLPFEVVQLPGGEAAKTLASIEVAARALTRLGVDRGEPLVAIGGGALTDAAGFLAATYLRGVPVILVPTTLVGQVDAAIGGKTAVDLPEGKNLVGAFHQPVAIVIDVAVLATLPARERRAALGEAVKMAALGNGRLFQLLEEDGPAMAAGDASAFKSGALAELVERTAWAKVEVVMEDEREADGRIALNLGHSLGHALEAAAGFHGLLHGEAVAYGLRAAARIGVERGVTPPDRAARLEAVLDRLELGRAPLELDLAAVLGALDADKKRRAGRLRWVLPTADGYALDAEVPEALVRAVAAEVIAGRPAPAGAGAGTGAAAR
jgi:3-dehydroquinate synthetase/shikimate kinase